MPFIYFIHWVFFIYFGEKKEKKQFVYMMQYFYILFDLELPNSKLSLYLLSN